MYQTMSIKQAITGKSTMMSVDDSVLQSFPTLSNDIFIDYDCDCTRIEQDIC